MVLRGGAVVGGIRGQLTVDALHSALPESHPKAHADVGSCPPKENNEAALKDDTLAFDLFPRAERLRQCSGDNLLHCWDL